MKTHWLVDGLMEQKRDEIQVLAVLVQQVGYTEEVGDLQGQGSVEN